MALRALLLCFVVAALAATASAVNRPEAKAETAGAARPTKQAVRTVVRARPTVEVAFVRNGRLVSVERTVPKGTSPARHALRELLQGPTKLERHEGLRSAFRPGARLRSLRAVGDTWLVRVSRSALGFATATTIDTRLRQLSATLSPLGPQGWAAVAAEGRLATVLRIGTRPSEWVPVSGEKGYPYTVRGIQLQLWRLGYLDRASVTGSVDYLTEQALLAFQGWNDLSRTGTVTGETQLTLFRAAPPRPTTHRSGRRIEIHRDLGVLLMIDGNEVRRAVHTSTGAGGITPSGSYHVYRKETMSWSVPFSTWMPYASYFVGGIAMHEYSYVPSYPASHGCVRLPAGEANRVYAFADYGMPVYVY
jgi:hypothetical protein